MSLKTEIEAIVGDIDSPDYTAQAVLYLTEGVKFITKYIMNNTEFDNLPLWQKKLTQLCLLS